MLNALCKLNQLTSSQIFGKTLSWVFREGVRDELSILINRLGKAGGLWEVGRSVSRTKGLERTKPPTVSQITFQAATSSYPCIWPQRAALADSGAKHLLGSIRVCSTPSARSWDVSASIVTSVTVALYRCACTHLIGCFLQDSD